MVNSLNLILKPIYKYNKIYWFVYMFDLCWPLIVWWSIYVYVSMFVFMMMFHINIWLQVVFCSDSQTHVQFWRQLYLYLIVKWCECISSDYSGPRITVKSGFMSSLCERFGQRSTTVPTWCFPLCASTLITAVSL